jgi:hypothetical protein
MAIESSRVIPYASRDVRPRRFRHLLAVLPFSAGLCIGGCAAAAIIGTAPDFVPGVMISILTTLGLAAVFAAALTTLFLFGCFASTPRVARPWPICAIVGSFVPSVTAMTLLAGQTAFVLISLPPSLKDGCGWGILGLIAIITLASPFLLMQWNQGLPTTGGRRKQIRSALKAAAIAMAFCTVALIAGRYAAEKYFDRKCETLAAWVRSAHPLPGAYTDLPLPNSLHALSDDGLVDAVVTPDNRVVLMLKTLLWFHHNWFGVIYSTGPITANEIGPDGWDRTRVSFPGLPYHFIAHQHDSRHFSVGSDVD